MSPRVFALTGVIIVIVNDFRTLFKTRLAAKVLCRLQVERGTYETCVGAILEDRFDGLRTFAFKRIAMANAMCLITKKLSRGHKQRMSTNRLLAMQAHT